MFCSPGINSIVKRGEERKYEHYTAHHDFEVDNYLNLFHKQTGLYLMFHKTSFPDISFYLAKQFTQIGDKPYYKIYESKRMETLTFAFRGYQLKDNRPNMIQQINELVPENYKHVFELYNNFRKLQPIKELSDSIDEELPEETSDTDPLDGQSRIINGLRLKLNETIKRCENQESIVSDMVEEYNNKSIELQHSEREKHLTQSKFEEVTKSLEEQKKEVDETLKQKDKDMNQEINKVKQDYELKLTDNVESKNRENFSLYKRLSESEVFRAKSEALGISYESLQRNLEKETLDKKKIKDMNTALLSQFGQETERNNKLSNDNSDLMKQLDEKEYLTTQHGTIIKELSNKLGKTTKECSSLTEKLSKMGNTSSNVLENALSDRISDLEEELHTLQTDKTSIQTVNHKLSKDLETIRGFMSNI